MRTNTLDRYRGALLGLAVGDALGAQIEFMQRDTYAPVVGMNGGGPHNLKPGQWTDDTSMALCMAESLIENCGRFAPSSIMEKWVRWWRCGYLSSTGRCFDIGATTSQALSNYIEAGEVNAPTGDYTADNGSLMRLAPIVMASKCPHEAISAARASSILTHQHEECLSSCEVFATYLWRALWGGGDKSSIVAPPQVRIKNDTRLMAIACGSFRVLQRSEIKSTGYVLDTLEAALWSFWHSRDFASAVLAAVNLGDDADTVAAVTGQIAGAYYGADAIPREWLSVLIMHYPIRSMADRLYQIATR